MGLRVRGNAYVAVDGIALGRKGTLEEGPKERIERVHSFSA